VTKIKMEDYELFDEYTQAIIFGYQQKPIQRMLDFDYVCGRETPSVAAIINPTRGGYHNVSGDLKKLFYQCIQPSKKRQIIIPKLM